jgi:Uri superfamily endonuclease
MIEALPGTYALLLRSDTPVVIQVGSLGQLVVEPGFYLYIGSALGPGGLRGRLGHHLKPVTRPHWHVDYLRQVAQVVEIRYVISGERLECAWARQLAALAEVSIPLKKFGASDCDCPAHLFYSARKNELHFSLGPPSVSNRRLLELNPLCGFDSSSRGILSPGGDDYPNNR